MLEQDLKSLEELIKKMEIPEQSLEQSLELFQQGIVLVKKCTVTLEQAEIKVKEILENNKGEFNESDIS